MGESEGFCNNIQLQLGPKEQMPGFLLLWSSSLRLFVLQNCPGALSFLLFVEEPQPEPRIVASSCVSICAYFLAPTLGQS